MIAKANRESINPCDFSKTGVSIFFVDPKYWWFQELTKYFPFIAVAEVGGGGNGFGVRRSQRAPGCFRRAVLVWQRASVGPLSIY